MQKSPQTRFAPSPTGLLHQGHLLHALCLWGFAREVGARIFLRIEDHDRQRCKSLFSKAMMEDIQWVGFTPDEGLSKAGEILSDCFQSAHFDRYENSLRRLIENGQVYSCFCSRGDIRKRAAKSGMPLSHYDGKCRDKNHPLKGGTLRVSLPKEESILVTDLESGHISGNPGDLMGDFALRDRFGNYTYQFCVVVDDLYQGIDLIIRGTDLKASTPAQVALRRILAPEQKDPVYWHHPVVMAQDGSGKLSKSNGASPIADLREAGHLPARILGDLAFTWGLQSENKPVFSEDVAVLFREGLGGRVFEAFRSLR